MKFAASLANFSCEELRGPSNRAMRKTAFFQVTLMIFLGPEKFRRGLNLGHNLALESSALCQRILGFFCHGLLLRRMIKNNGAILGANIGPLPVQGCGIM